MLIIQFILGDITFDYVRPISNNSIVSYRLGYSYSSLDFGIRGLTNSIGEKTFASPALGFGRKAASYKIYYFTLGSTYEYYFKKLYEGFAISLGPKLYYQIAIKHKRAELLNTGDIVALPIDAKQRGLNKLAAHINISIAYNVPIRSVLITLGFQNAIRVRSFYSDIPIGNRYFNRGLFLGVHF